MNKYWIAIKDVSMHVYQLEVTASLWANAIIAAKSYVGLSTDPSTDGYLLNVQLVTATQVTGE